MERTGNFFFQKEFFYVIPTAFIGELYLSECRTSSDEDVYLNFSLG